MRARADDHAAPEVDAEFLGYLIVRERRTWLLVTFGALVVAGASLAFFLRRAHAPGVPWPAPLAGAAALLPFVNGRRARSVRVAAGPGWLALGTGGRRREVQAGHLRRDVREVATVRVRVRNRRGRLELGAESAEQGRRLLRTLRVDAARATDVFEIAAGSAHALARDAAIAAGAAGALAAGLLAARALHAAWAPRGFAGAALSLAVLPAGAVAFAAWAARRRVRAEVGVDGVATRNAYGRSTFYPFERVAALDERRLELVLTDRAGGRAPFAARRVDEFDGFAQRLVEAFALFRAAKSGGGGWQVLLPPEGVATPDWLARLRALGGDGAQGYRALGIERARLLALAESPSVPPLGRAAAAFVLFERLAPGELERVRAAAETSAHAGLRAALASVVRGDRVETARAMAGLRAVASGAWGELGGARR